MKFFKYIQGDRKGKDAHRIEREAMQDPFLADAIEGYNTIKDDHIRRIENLQKQVSASSHKRYNYLKICSIAASLLVIISVGGYFILYDNQPAGELYSRAMTPVNDNEEIHPQKINDSEISENESVAKKSIETSKIYHPQSEASMEVMEVADEKIEEHQIAAETIVAPPIQLEEEQAPINVQDAIFAFAAADKVASKETSLLSPIIKGKVSDEYGDQTKKDSIPAPQPLIGEKAYSQYLKDHLIRPIDENCKDIKGKVVLTFRIDTKGKPTQITIEKGLCPSADAEAIRLIQEGSAWTTGDKEVNIEVKF